MAKAYAQDGRNQACRSFAAKTPPRYRLGIKDAPFSGVIKASVTG
jgi:hypothetical protein